MFMCERGARRCRVGPWALPRRRTAETMTASPAMTGSKHQRGVAGNFAGELLVGGGGREHFDLRRAAVATVGSWLQSC